MTIEAVRQKKSLFGLRTVEKRRLLDFRSWTKKISSMITYSKHSDTALLHMGNIFNPTKDPFIFAKPISEDEVIVYESDLRMNHTEQVEYSREKINEANLVDTYGAKIQWRETQPGDYPPLKPGQEADPIQLKLGLRGASMDGDPIHPLNDVYLVYRKALPYSPENNI